MPDNTNSSIRYRNGGGLTYDESMPEFLKRQFQQRTDSEGGNGPYWMMPDALVDEQGNQLILADDRGDIIANGERALKEGATTRWIDGIGYAANMADTESTGKFEERMKRNRAAALTIMLAAGVGGALAAGGAAAGGAETAAALGAADADAAAVAAGLNSGGPGAAGSAAAGGTAGSYATEGLVAGSQPGAAAATPTATVPPDIAVSAPSPGTGAVLSEIPAIQQPSWWSQLPQGARDLLTRAGFSAVSTGASAALADRRQERAIDAAADERQRDRDEHEDRRRVVASNVTYTPRPVGGGLIEARQRGRTG